MIAPPLLRKGDTIGIVTLGSPIEKSIVEQGMGLLQKMGYKILLGKYVYGSDFPASSAIQRATDLMDMFKNPQVKMIMGSRGGTGVQGILPYLDYPTIQKKPKILVGYSDLSILLNTINRFTGLITFNGPMLLDFKPNEPIFNYDQLLATVSSPLAWRPIYNPAEMPLITKVRGKATGPIVGGNITSILGSLGTPFEIDTRGKILFLEDINENSTKIYRGITQLIQARKFQNCLGIIMGECTDCTAAYHRSYDQIIDELLVPLNKPLMTNLATGHGKYKVTIPIGSKVHLDTTTRKITVVSS